MEEPVERTTPEGIDLQATFRRMLDAGDEACAMEVSSHALELGRAEGIHFACRVFTNLTQDHLDFHPDMEAYFAAKRRLFDTPGAAIVNVDDEYGRRLAGELGDAITYGVESEADYRARDVDFDPSGSSFVCETPDGTIEVRTRLPGLFNVQNALAALAASRALGRRRSRRPAPRWPRPSACPGASSRSTRASRSRCSSTTPTRRRRSTTCCAPRAS